MPSINDYSVYNKAMQKGIRDKLFFYDFLKKHSEIENFIDFGCADGTLLSYVHKDFPKLKLYGVDKNQEMIELAKKKLSCNLIQSNEFPIIEREGVTVLNLSSVLHEVFFYSCPNELDNFFNNILKSKIDYIFIRDMFFMDYYQYIEEEIPQDVMDRIDEKYKAQRIDFERYYNTSIRNNKKDFVHFLLKYTYRANWERELAENYFSHTPRMLIDRLTKYDVVRYGIYTLPFKRLQVLNEFGYTLDVPTHYKMILKLNHFSAN